MPAWTAVIALLFALLLDRWFGEPPARLHPVVWMGKYLGWMGLRIAPHAPYEPGGEADWRAFWAGALAWYGGAVLVGIAAWAVQQVVLQRLDAGLFSGLALGLLLKPMLAWRMLRDEVAAVEASLADSLDAGRRRLGWLVSREVMRLDESQVRESALETLAENLNDSVIAPLFWFVVAGLPGAVVYRFANTADAMWGYPAWRGAQYWQWAGKFAARADDVLSWVPARITALLLAAAAGGLSFAQLHEEAERTRSPNSGWPMAALALALAVRLRKPGVYTLNPSGAAPVAADTARGIDLAVRVVALFALLGALACFVIAGERPW